jgi:hypothetical protein
MAGDMRSQDFSEQSAKAQAADAIERFNTANRQNVAGANTNRMNRSQEMNLEAKQNLMNSNTNLNNQEQIHNKQIIVDDYNRRMARAKAIADLKGGNATASQARSDAKDKQWSGTMQGAAGVAGTIGAGLTKADNDDLDNSIAQDPLDEIAQREEEKRSREKYADYQTRKAKNTYGV